MILAGGLVAIGVVRAEGSDLLGYRVTGADMAIGRAAGIDDAGTVKANSAGAGRSSLLGYPAYAADPLTGGYGMMGGGYGYGMMGPGYDAASFGIDLDNGQVTTSEQALAIAKAYVGKLDQGLGLDEIHEFQDAYEVELKELQNGEKAFEFMIAKSGGRIFTEMGPNVMWNVKYGHMNWGADGKLTVSPQDATKTAQAFVTSMGQEYSVENPEAAPGYGVAIHSLSESYWSKHYLGARRVR